MRVLRLCSVYEAPAGALSRRGIRFDPVGGMQNHTSELSRCLDRLGVAQTVLTTRPPTAPASEPLGRHGVVLRVGLPVPWLRQGYGAAAALAAPRLARDVDLVHVHLGEDLAVLPVGASAARAVGVPLVLTVHTSLRHTLHPSDLRSILLRIAGGRVERWGEHRADVVITLTARLRRLLVDDGVDPDRVHVVPSGVGPAVFGRPTGDPLASFGRPRVLFVGRLHPQKGVSTLLEAAAVLRTRGARVVIVGDGPLRAEVERTVAAAGLGRIVTVVGAVPHERVPALLAAADLLVLPSRYEELGSVLLEGMAAGLPTVASRSGGIPDVISHGENGLLVPAEDPVALAAAIAGCSPTRRSRPGWPAARGRTRRATTGTCWPSGCWPSTGPCSRSGRRPPCSSTGPNRRYRSWSVGRTSTSLTLTCGGWVTA